MDISNSLNPSVSQSSDQRKGGNVKEKNDESKALKEKGSLGSDRQAAVAGEAAGQQKVSEVSANSKSSSSRSSVRDRAKSDIARAALQQIAGRTQGTTADLQAANAARPTEERGAGDGKETSRDSGNKSKVKMIDL